MEQKEIDQIFYRDGFRIAMEHLEKELSAEQLRKAIAAMYAGMDSLIDALLARSQADSRAVACKKGCSWCCHQEVFAISHEFLYLNEFVQQHLDAASRERVLKMAREKVMITMDKSVEEQLKIRAACPFLYQGACVAYKARPMACRIYLSTSEPSCRKEHDQPGRKGHAKLLDFPLRAGRMMNEGFVGYLKQRGMESSELPIEQGYASLQTLGQTMEDWLSAGK